MGKGDWRRPAGVAKAEVDANFAAAGILEAQHAPDDGSCPHSRRTLRDGLFHCLECDYIQPESERITFDIIEQPRLCARCGGQRPSGEDSCRDNCTPAL